MFTHKWVLARDTMVVNFAKYFDDEMKFWISFFFYLSADVFIVTSVLCLSYNIVNVHVLAWVCCTEDG